MNIQTLIHSREKHLVFWRPLFDCAHKTIANVDRTADNISHKPVVTGASFLDSHLCDLCYTPRSHL